MLPDTAIYDCIDYLFQDKTDEMNLQYLCKLLTIIDEESNVKTEDNVSFIFFVFTI